MPERRLEKENQTSELPRWLCQTRPAAMKPSRREKKKKNPGSSAAFLGQRRGSGRIMQHPDTYS